MADVAAAAHRRVAAVSQDVYDVILREIPELRDDKPVLHDLQARVDVTVDARREQGEHSLVVVEFRDLPQDRLVDISGHRGDPVAHCRRDARHQRGDRRTIHVHQRILT